MFNAEVYMVPTFTVERMLKTSIEYQIQDLLLVPPIAIRLVRDPVVERFDLSHIRYFTCGAAPLSAEVILLMKRKFPGTGLKQGYGMTESCGIITAHPRDQYDYSYANRAGTIVANTELKIIDPDNSSRELGYNESGEILARGPQIVMGYLNNEKATRETFDADGWLHTGDVGFMDREGFLTVTDRIKEMIKVNAIGVAPAELEDLLLGHPAVEDVAVLAIPDDYTGERPKAYAVLNPDVKSSLSSLSKLSRREHLDSIGHQLLSYVKENRVRTKWIVEVEFIDQIPKSSSGKILRRVLRNMEKTKSGEKSDGKRIIVRDDTSKKNAPAKL
jgi:4-coumarate--CoA ligase